MSDGSEALFIAPDAFFSSQRVQFATLATRYSVPTAWASRDAVEAGGLLSYTTDSVDMFRHVGFYTGIILKGIKPADLPVVQSTKFELVINLQTARLLGIAVPQTLLAIADVVIQLIIVMRIRAPDKLPVGVAANRLTGRMATRSDISSAPSRDAGAPKS